MSEDCQQDMSEMNVVFIHSQLDDAGLSVHAFRVYCHLARRSKQRSFPARNTIAGICRMNKSTVSVALNELIQRGMIIREARDGLSSLYTLTPPSTWGKCSTEPSRKEGPAENRGRLKEGASPRLKLGAGYPAENRGYEGNPLEDIQQGLPGGSPGEGDLASSSTVEHPERDANPSAERKRPRNLPFDALAVVDGWRPGTTLTRGEAGRVAAALRDIRAVWPAPEGGDETQRLAAEADLAREIARRAVRWPKVFPHATMTSTALACHWAKLRPEATALGTVDVAAATGGRLALPPDCDFRKVALSIGLYIGADVPWWEVSHESRRKILEAHNANGLIA